MRAMILGCLTACLVAAAPVRAQDQTAKAAIAAADKAFVAAFNKHDAAGIAAIYSSTAEAFPPNSDIVKGRDAIQKMWQGALDQGIATVDVATTEVHAEGNLAYEVGTYSMQTADGKVADRGKYCVVWIKEAGQWKLHRDIWSTNLPASTSKQ
ncbi:MAG TPA: DUF4440 domain-containing protein [Burkholderiales bacterium]|nr:DUF4440 domain-containing protein [Burkholderiales bacterium]